MLNYKEEEKKAREKKKKMKEAVLETQWEARVV